MTAKAEMRKFVTALAAPDVGQQPLADVDRDGLPALTGGFGVVKVGRIRQV